MQKYLTRLTDNIRQGLDHVIKDQTIDWSQVHAECPRCGRTTPASQIHAMPNAYQRLCGGNGAPCGTPLASYLITVRAFMAPAFRKHRLPDDPYWRQTRTTTTSERRTC